MSFSADNLLLYAVTDRAWVGKMTLYEQVRAALEGGVTCVQLREKELGHEEFLACAIKMRTLCHQYNVPLIINDDVEIAVMSDADGAHVGQSDMEARNARSALGAGKILGVSVRTPDEALHAQMCGADYIGVGAVFPTATKSDAKYVSAETLREICRTVNIPAVAIGGINGGNIMELAGSGVRGAAIVSAIFGARDIKGECVRLKTLAERAFK